MEVSPAGGKLWRLKYRFGAKEKLLALGKYPTVGLREARQKREEAKAQLSRGVDPGELKKVSRSMGHRLTAESFESVAREWFANFSPRWAESHAEAPPIWTR